MKTIKCVEAREDYSLLITLDNGSSITLNMAGRLKTVRFGLFEDMPFFLRAETDGSTVRWGNYVEMSLSEIMQLAQK